MPLSLLARFPKLRTPAEPYPVIPPDARERYPELADDLTELAAVVEPVFSAYDRQALKEQNAYRRQQVLVLLGSALVTTLGGIQALVPGQRWPGLVLALAGVLLATSSQWARERASIDEYLQARVRAERLRALHFRYLARVGPYAGPDRLVALRRAVIAVKAGKEPE
ncbi:hypothetical protein GCM10010435_69360 [Winogradskya consettensis]|uniref:DUF4231 domain-containing protein n=1 Tax=Winogradskya consettensis TaxID=113560 RepID=A0A919SL70_9ACTN|nr:DUF4231 domain-containing protein [Actinoplanes consettensis]GIM73472.1 hypothetical protein Aco04nite_35420 [Actinoplanes consettensis]